MDKDGTLFLGYFHNLDLEGQIEVIIVYWDGQTWQQVGELPKNFGIAFPSSSTSRISLVLDDEGMPVVAWVGYDDSSGQSRLRLFIKHWNGGSWQDLEEGSVSQSNQATFDVALDYRNGRLVLATIESGLTDLGYEASQLLYIRELNSKRWQLLGDTYVSVGAACPVIRLDSQGNPYVAWSYIIDDGGEYYRTQAKLSHFIRE